MKLAAITLNWVGATLVEFGTQRYPAGHVVVSCAQARGPQGVPVLRATGSVPAINQWLAAKMTMGDQVIAGKVIMEARRRGRLETL